MHASTEPVNQLHRTLRQLTVTDPTCQQSVAWVFNLIKHFGYQQIRSDPGIVAWVMENEHVLKQISDARRAAYDDVAG